MAELLTLLLGAVGGVLFLVASFLLVKTLVDTRADVRENAARLAEIDDRLAAVEERLDTETETDD